MKVTSTLTPVHLELTTMAEGQFLYTGMFMLGFVLLFVFVMHAALCNCHYKYAKVV